MTEQSALIDLITESRSSVEAAAQIAGAWSAAKMNLLADFKRQLIASAPAGWSVSGELTERRMSEIRLLKSSRKEIAFALQFEGSDLRNLAYGLALAEPNPGLARHFHESVERSRFGRGEGPTAEWAWWRNASERDDFLPVPADWTWSGDAWRRVIDATLAPDVLRLAQQLIEAATAVSETEHQQTGL